MPSMSCQIFENGRPWMSGTAATMTTPASPITRDGTSEGGILVVRRCGTGVPPESALGDEAQFPCPGDGLGAVGRAELAEDVADVLFDREDGDEQLLGDGPVRHARGKHRQ